MCKLLYCDALNMTLGMKCEQIEISNRAIFLTINENGKMLNMLLSLTEKG